VPNRLLPPERAPPFQRGPTDPSFPNVQSTPGLDTLSPEFAQPDPSIPHYDYGNAPNAYALTTTDPAVSPLGQQLGQMTAPVRLPGASQNLRNRAFGVNLIHPQDPTYPAGFAQLYNTGMQALRNSEDPGELDGFGPLSTKMAVLDSQRKIYQQGLQNLPPAIAQSIVSNPQYSEGQAQGSRSDIAGGEPYSPTPQIDDIRRLFRNRTLQNAPTSQSLTPTPLQRQYPALMKLPGFSGFVGGDNI
jgi:hypothetical protein